MAVPSTTVPRRGERLLTLVTAVVASVAVLVQLGLDVANAASPGVLATAIRDLSYFTMLSNLLVALACAVPLVAPRTAAGSFLARPGVRAALVVYIVVTGAVYIALIAPHRPPVHGAYGWTDLAFHYVIPVLYPVLWALHGAHGRLGWSDAARWLVFPAAYLAWTLARGQWTGTYPYAFVDVDALGMAAVLRNAVGLFAVFFVLGLGVVAIDRALGRRLGVVITR